MATWVLWAVINHQRRCDAYAAAQAVRAWAKEVDRWGGVPSVVDAADRFDASRLPAEAKRLYDETLERIRATPGRATSRHAVPNLPIRQDWCGRHASCHNIG